MEFDFKNFLTILMLLLGVISIAAIVLFRSNIRRRVTWCILAASVALALIVAVTPSAIQSRADRIDVDTEAFRRSFSSVERLRQETQTQPIPSDPYPGPKSKPGKVGELDVQSVYLLHSGDFALVQPSRKGSDKVKGFVYSGNPLPVLNGIASGWKLEQVDTNWWKFIGWS